MDRFYKSHDSHAVENVIGCATLVRAAPGLGTPFAYELACCIKQGQRFFGLQTGAQDVELITPGDERAGPGNLHRTLSGISA